MLAMLIADTTPLSSQEHGLRTGVLRTNYGTVLGNAPN